MKKHGSRAVLFCICGLLLILICRLAVYILITAHRYKEEYGGKAAAKEFVEYLILHGDEAAADFEECGLTFEKAEEEMSPDLYEIVPWGAGGIGDVLIVTDADGRRFYYQTSEKYGDLLLKIDGSVEKIYLLDGKSEPVTGHLKIERERWGKNYAFVSIWGDDSGLARYESCWAYYRLPDFDDYDEKLYRAEDAIQAIEEWISTEELSALYKKGRELEEILSAYCELKRHNADVTIRYTPLYGKAASQ
ncbi:MAG: hypothetical protein NC337_14350 [Roseburia sp.]|nr:hypothetical protein [Roseburia sp.]